MEILALFVVCFFGAAIFSCISYGIAAVIGDPTIRVEVTKVEFPNRESNIRIADSNQGTEE